MDHQDIWRAIDTLAAENGLSVSNLARQAGLDPTTFNPSKRQTPAGRARWPGTEGLAKILRATNTSLETFARLVAGERAIPSPRLGHARRQAQAADTEQNDPFKGGRPSGCWQAVPNPSFADPQTYTLKIVGGSLRPAFHDGDLIVVSPQAPLTEGNLVIVRTVLGETTARRLLGRSHLWFRFSSLDSGQECRAKSCDLLWVHRVVWASQ